MTKHELQNLIGECMQDYFAETQPVKENTMKKSALKALVSEVVRQCVKEAGPQYKVRTNKSQVEQPGKINRARQIQSDPKVNEVAPPGGEKVVKAIKKSGSADNPWAVAWSMKNKGQIENADPTGEEAPEMSPEMSPEMDGDEHGYDEQEEVELLKQLGQIVLKLLQMHRGEDTEAGEEAEAGEEGGDDGVPFKGPEAAETEPEGDNEEELQESNHKVQHRSAKTVKDLENNPKNVRDPKVPQA